jgi:hypothetical protein
MKSRNDAQSEMQRVAKEAETLSQLIASRNAQYLKREEELSHAITAAAHRIEGGVANTAMDDVSQVMQSAEPIVSDLQKRILAKRQEEFLAGTAVVRLQSHVSTMNEVAGPRASKLHAAHSAATELIEKSRDHRKAIGTIANLTFHSGSLPARVESEPGLDGEMAPAVVSGAAIATRLLELLSVDVVSAMNDDGETRIAALVAVDASILAQRRHFDEQNTVLGNAHAAIETLERSTAEARRERDSLLASLQKVETEISELSTSANTSAVDESALYNDVLKHRSLLASKQRQLHTAQSARKRVEDERTHNRNLRDEAVAARIKADDDLNEAHRTKTLLESQLRSQTELGKSLERELHKLQHVLATSLDDLSKLNTKFIEEDSAAGRSIAALKSHRQDLVQLQHTCTAKAGEVSSLQDQLSAIRSATGVQNQETLDLKSRVIELQDEAIHRKETADRLSSRVLYLKSLLPPHHPLAHRA